jgi:carbonic anhydrase
MTSLQTGSLSLNLMPFDLNAIKTEIIDAVKDTVKELARQETVSAVMETVAETKEGVTELKGLMTDMMQELTATHEDVRYVRTTVAMLTHSDAVHEAAIESLRTRVERVERKIGIAK